MDVLPIMRSEGGAIMNDLKPCPSCGGLIKVSTGRKSSGRWAARNKCETCGLELTCFGETKDDAIISLLKVWNIRHESTPVCGAKVTDFPTAIEDAIGEVIERYPNTMDMLGDE